MAVELPALVKARMPELAYCCGSLCNRQRLIAQAQAWATEGPVLIKPAQVGDKVFSVGTPWLQVILAATELYETEQQETNVVIDND